MGKTLPGFSWAFPAASRRVENVCDRLCPSSDSGWLKKTKMDINDITYAINGAVFEVNRILGPGFLEKVYENALIVELREKGLKVENQVPIKVSYKGSTVGDYIADIIVEGQILLELKTVEQLNKTHTAQLLNYLKATGLSIGILINFFHEKAEIKRFKI